MKKGEHTSAISRARGTVPSRTSLREFRGARICAVLIKFFCRFPQSVAHGLQALDDGLELLLLFSDGDFDATGTTFMLSDWLVHTPLEIVAQNLGLKISDLQEIPTQDPYIFRSTVPPPQEGHADQQAKHSPDGDVPSPYVFSMSKQEKEVSPGGWIKIQDSTRNFKESYAATAYVYVEPNGLRELHWHRDDGTLCASDFTDFSLLTLWLQNGFTSFLDTGGSPRSPGVPPRGLSTFKPVIPRCSQVLMVTTYAFSGPSWTLIRLNCS